MSSFAAATLAKVPALHFKVLGADDKEYGQLEKCGTDGSMIGRYYILKHGDNYKIELENPFLCKCDAKIEIDGYHMGSWVLETGQKGVIERPVKEAKKFMFLRTKLVKEAEVAKTKLDSLGGDKSKLTPSERKALELSPLGSGIDSGRLQNGIVRVTYTPMKGESTITVNVLGNGAGFKVDVSRFSTAEDIKKAISSETSIPEHCLLLTMCNNTSESIGASKPVDEHSTVETLKIKTLYILLQHCDKNGVLTEVRESIRSKFVFPVKVRMSASFSPHVLEFYHFAGDNVSNLITSMRNAVRNGTGKRFEPIRFTNIFLEGFVDYSSNEDSLLSRTTYTFEVVDCKDIDIVVGRWVNEKRDCVETTREKLEEFREIKREWQVRAAREQIDADHRERLAEIESGRRERERERPEEQIKTDRMYEREIRRAKEAKDAAEAKEEKRQRNATESDTAIFVHFTKSCEESEFELKGIIRSFRHDSGSYIRNFRHYSGSYNLAIFDIQARLKDLVEDQCIREMEALDQTEAARRRFIKEQIDNDHRESLVEIEAGRRVREGLGETIEADRIYEREIKSAIDAKAAAEAREEKRHNKQMERDCEHHRRAGLYVRQVLDAASNYFHQMGDQSREAMSGVQEMTRGAIEAFYPSEAQQVKRERQAERERQANVAAGATTLQGASSQTFGTVASFQIDYSRAIVSEIRLGCDADEELGDEFKGRFDRVSVPTSLKKAAATAAPALDEI